MQTGIPEKILLIIQDLETGDNVPLTRLRVLEKWFAVPDRLTAFGLWMARRAAGRKGKTKGAAGALLDETRALLGTSSTRASFFQSIAPAIEASLHDRAQAFHTEFQKQQWGPVRIIYSWPVFLVEQGLALHLGLKRKPGDGYKLAADWAQNHGPSHGNGLNGPSRGKLEELLRFMFALEALEDEPR